MAYDLYLSYSGRKTYLTCPKKYWFKYVIKDPARDSPKGSLFGSTIGKVFEWFYEKKAWAQPDPVAATISFIEPAIEVVFHEEDFNPMSDPGFCTVLRQELAHYVPIGVEIIRQNGFLTPYSQAETDLTVVYGSDKYGMVLKLGGRSDFIHSEDMRKVWILDGKGSKHREKYVDAEQLIWYAVQHYIKYHVAPTRLGFIFYRFPDDPIKWISYDGAAMHASLDQTFDVANKIKLQTFDPTPSGECHRCPYRGKCDEGTRHIAQKKVESGGRIEESIFDLERV